MAGLGADWTGNATNKDSGLVRVGEGNWATRSMPPSTHPIHPIPSHPIPDPDSTDLGRKSNHRHTSSPRLPLRPCHFSLWCPCLDSRVATLCVLCSACQPFHLRHAPHLHLQYLLSALASSCCLDEHSELANSKPRKASKQTDLRASRTKPAGRTLLLSLSLAAEPQGQASKSSQPVSVLRI